MFVTRAELETILGTSIPDGVDGIDAVTHDSRAAGPGGAFVAVPGFTVDGVTFVPQAMANGVSLVVAERDVDGAPTAVVPDARAALAALATATAGHPSHDVVVYGITGTNGKTTSSYVLHGILSAAYGEEHTGLLTTAEIVVGTHREPAVRTTGEAPQVQGNLARMRDAGVQHVVLETSSHGIHLQRVAGTRYATALFTNLTRDHIDLHGTMEDYFLTKRRLFEWTEGPKLTNVDDAYGARIVTEVPGTLGFGVSEKADYRISDARPSEGGTAFTLTTPATFLDGREAPGRIELQMPLLGDYNVHNVAGASAIALEMGMPLDTLVDAVKNMGQVPGRFERVAAATDKGFEVVVDYAHTEVGLELVLDVARDVISPEGRVICVYGAAGRRDPAKRPKMGEVASRLADVNIITNDDTYDEDPQAIADEVMAGADAADTTVVLDRREAIRQALAQARPGDIVVVAGKGHERVQHLPDGDVDFHDTTVVTELLAES
ncbi:MULTISPECIES: UDP-N-acetylmuramoyl-L-alanyl-D-glutamate--2,6-diaminopimelate ligase [Dermacoccus]|uniref:UDP-N-acetylmuramyl-tripeptide synthetase n=2 Tax=Dermacoccus TaxID=57495 RepID=A0A417Z3F5_9MICO|nr:UDP-N-acetylmuramoyl-L-alanyl-D-glutamate--2,6-diaminopimelate ligase [Dermacoccus abyssi]RHW45181.1 UDP-N-acetylmuramoyl-L-alanyl-D-glutamate--2,6-diaminopimelate ligase [Dermacoccus abyssi]